MLQPEGKNKEKRNLINLLFYLYVLFIYLLNLFIGLDFLEGFSTFLGVLPCTFDGNKAKLQEIVALNFLDRWEP